MDVGTNHVLPNCRRVSHYHNGLDIRQGLTFSIPQNLSVPSLRIGPAFLSMRSRGVGGAGGSFFDGDVAAFGLVVLW
jgi:hypothetical protein